MRCEECPFYYMDKTIPHIRIIGDEMKYTELDMICHFCGDPKDAPCEGEWF